MEFTELMMMETDDYFTSTNLDWLQEEVEADYCHYWDSLLLPVSSSSAGWPIQQLSNSSSSESAGTLTINPSPSSNSVTNLGGDDIVEAGGNTEKPAIKRRSRASSKKMPTTQRYINATAKNFKDLVQKHTGRPAVPPPPFTLISGGSSYPIKGPVTFSFGTGDAYYEQYYESDSVTRVDQAGHWHATDYNQDQQLQGYNIRY